MKATRQDVTGQYAGAITRFLANSVDVAIAGFLFLTGSAMLDYALRAIAGIEISTGSISLGRTVAFAIWLFLYWWTSIAVAAKTPGKALLGLRVLNRSGDILSSPRAALRAAALPLSYILFGAGFLGIVVSRERRALHDMIAGSVVVYDWGNRSAELPTPITAFLDRRSGKELADDESS
ncbi:MAG: RDD family protein [Actinomycetota bacterium]|nr:RDD family protein [Actinomycetota bacterium]